MVLGKLYQIIVSPESEIRYAWDDLPYSNHQFPVSLLKSTIYTSPTAPSRRNKKHMPNIQICVPHTQFFHGGCGRQNPDLPRCLKACARTKDNNEARACGRSSHCRSSCGAPWLVQKLGIPIGNHRENGDFINKTWGFHGIYSWFMIAKLTHITRLTMVHARYIYSWCDL